MTNRPDTDQENLEQLKLLVERISDYAIYMLTPDGVVASWNEGARRFKGYERSEILGRHFSIFYTPEDLAAGLPARALATAKELGHFEAEGWRVRKDGKRFWASVVMDRINDDQGNLVGFAKITRDISERKAADVARREGELHFKLLVQGVVDYAIYMLSPEGEVSTWNGGAERIKGYAANEVLGTHFSRFYTEEDRAAGRPGKALSTARAEGRFEAEGWRVRKDGSRFRAHVVIDAIRDEAGNLVGFAKVTRDITERMLLESAQAALHSAQRLEAIGKLTGGVAHDFNNILQVIGGSVQLLSELVHDNASALRYANIAMNAVERGAKLSSQLLAFARRQPLQPVVVNAGRIVRGIEDLTQRALGEQVEIESVISGGLWNTLIDPNQLENVILNLAINARDAMPEGGKLTLEVGNAMLDDNYVRSEPDVPPGQYVVVSVSDTGGGMPADVLERAVEPFFTTKGEGKGTGLGLSMAFGFVKQSGGHFRIYSEVGHGTTIKMYFPRVHANEDLRPSALPTEVTGGDQTILVVEDDPTVQAMVVETLTGLGYKVLKADNAEDALAVLKAGVHCDLLFTDVVMPGSLRTPELARQAKALLPHLEVLFTSGYTQNAIIHGGRLDPGVQLLSKPYRREDLARKISAILKPGKRAAPRHVLMVEDNEDARLMAVQVTEVLGYKVSAVGTAEAALALLATQDFDVLMTDVRLPGIDGISLAQKAKAAKPALHIVLCSGMSSLPEQTATLNAVHLLKPFNQTQLKAALG
ncbi:hybrid sensor histidine kinase/response regulator [Massilia endophytica]|uniref:hybrid sensor histidine kinase/response regulator n=1 Tax=Massilia endophytica TaxID=2899220 RepID=UPI001E37F9A1|nr:PAS domain S-box protein [Massilia endophytica]UGQ48578.1 PAS domain S-box protein [Massilia endophytica]